VRKQVETALSEAENGCADGTSFEAAKRPEEAITSDFRKFEGGSNLPERATTVVGPGGPEAVKGDVATRPTDATANVARISLDAAAFDDEARTTEGPNCDDRASACEAVKPSEDPMMRERDKGAVIRTGCETAIDRVGERECVASRTRLAAKLVQLKTRPEAENRGVGDAVDVGIGDRDGVAGGDWLSVSGGDCVLVSHGDCVPV
jgi:hypothetical protein